MADRAPRLYLCHCRSSTRQNEVMENLAEWLTDHGAPCTCDTQGDSLDEAKRDTLLAADVALLVCNDCPAPDSSTVTHATGDVRRVRFHCLDILERRGVPREKCRTILLTERPAHGQNPCAPLPVHSEDDRRGLLHALLSLHQKLRVLRRTLEIPAARLRNCLDVLRAALHGVVRNDVGVMTLEEETGHALRVLAEYRDSLRLASPSQPDNQGLRPDQAVGRLGSMARGMERLRRPDLARQLWTAALELAESALPANDTGTAQALLGLAASKWSLGLAQQAEVRVRQALDMLASGEGLSTPAAARGLNMLAGLAWARGDFLEAETYFGQALAVRQGNDPRSAATAESLNNLGELLRVQERFTEAEPLLVQALHLREDTLGPDHPLTAQSLCNLAKLRYALGRFSEAARFFRHTLLVQRGKLPQGHPDMAATLNDLAMTYEAMGDFNAAEELLGQAEAGYTGHPHRQVALENHARVLERLGRTLEAQAQRAAAAQERARLMNVVCSS